MDSKEAEAFAELSMEGGKDAEGEDAEYFEGDARLDEIAEALEEIIMDDGFQSRVARWCKQNCDAFTSAEENKLEYTPLFEAYQAMTEGHVETALRSYGISMAEVEALLVANADNLGADIFDVLVSMGDFGEFKQLMVSYRQEKEWERRRAGGGAGASGGAGGAGSASGSGSSSGPADMPYDSEEEEGGGKDGENEWIPQLDGLAPTVTPLSRTSSSTGSAAAAVVAAAAAAPSS